MRFKQFLEAVVGDLEQEMGEWLDDWVNTHPEIFDMKDSDGPVRAAAKKKFGDAVDKLSKAQLRKLWFQYQPQ